MKHLGTKKLETERLILRRFTINDATDMFHHWAGDPAVTKYLTWPAHNSIEASKGYLTALVDSYAQPNTYDWAIELKALGQVIGSIGAVGCSDAAGSVQIGYCLGRPWWRQGLATEAFSAVITYLMEQVGANRIEARHDPRNPSSGKVMEKCGLQYEGTLRESDLNNQGLCDAAWYALLRKDYCRPGR